MGSSKSSFQSGVAAVRGTLPPLTYFYSVEILGLMIRENKVIKGIYLFGKDYRLLQYADDTTILLGGSEISLKSALSLVDQFAKFSGLKPNYDKTCCIRIGSLKMKT